MAQVRRAEAEAPYAIASVPRGQAGAATPPGRPRGHWGVEDRPHYHRGVAVGEDANRTRSGSGPQVLAAPRDATIGRPRPSGSTNIAASLRRDAARVREALGVMRNLTSR